MLVARDACQEGRSEYLGLAIGPSLPGRWARFGPGIAWPPSNKRPGHLRPSAEVPRSDARAALRTASGCG